MRILKYITLFLSFSLFSSKIGLLIVATGKYIHFIPPLIESGKKYFLTSHEVTFFIFTDNILMELKNDPQVTLLHQEHFAWPLSSMLRYKSYLDNATYYKDYDYLFALDADALFVDTINDHILSDSVALAHPGFTLPKIEDLNKSSSSEYYLQTSEWTVDPHNFASSYEKNPFSTAHMQWSDAPYYYQACFFGGVTKTFLNIIATCYENIKKDLLHNIIALYHDESHLNKFFSHTPPQQILTPMFGYPDSYTYHQQFTRPYKAKILQLTKIHDYYRDLIS